MALMNLSAGQQWSCRHREQPRGQGGSEKVGRIENVHVGGHVCVPVADSC